MNKKLSSYLIWLVLAPVISLFVSYFGLRLTDLNVPRAVLFVVSIVATLLPILVLAYGIAKVWRLTTLGGVVIASLVSSIFWVVLAAIVNNYFQAADVQVTWQQDVLSIVIFTLIVSLVLYVGQKSVRRRQRPIA